MSTGTQVLAHSEHHWAPDAGKVALVMSSPPIPALSFVNTSENT